MREVRTFFSRTGGLEKAWPDPRRPTAWVSLGRMRSAEGRNGAASVVRGN